MAFPFTRRPRLAGALLALLAAAAYLGCQAFLIEPDSLIVAEYPLDLPAWPASLDGFRIAAVGDLHGGAPFIDERKLEEVARRVAAAKPDLIVWLGDYVIHGVLGGGFMPPEKVADVLGHARARYGEVAIIGNHDHGLDSVRVERAFAAAGIPFLRSAAREIVVKDSRLHLYGLDDFELVPNYWKILPARFGVPPEISMLTLGHARAH